VIITQALSETAKGRVGFASSLSAMYTAAKVTDGVCERKKNVVNNDQCMRDDVTCQASINVKMFRLK